MIRKTGFTLQLTGHDFDLPGFIDLETGECPGLLRDMYNPTTLEFFSYCEGDTSHWFAGSQAEFDAELLRRQEFYGLIENPELTAALAALKGDS